MFQSTAIVTCVSSVAALVLPLAVSAMPTVITGSGSSSGINAGFGNVIGSNSTLAISNDQDGNINWLLTPGGGNLDNANAVVIYIDTDNGATGFADTTGFNDFGAAPAGEAGFDELRAATSATNGTGERADIFFASGFKANYALAFNSGFGVAFQLDPAGHQFIDTIHGSGFGSGGPYAFTHTLAELQLTLGDSFRYVATYLDPVGTFRSDEFHGVSSDGTPPGNIGFNDKPLADGDFNTFNSVPEPGSLAAGLLGGLVMLRRRRA